MIKILSNYLKLSLVLNYKPVDFKIFVDEFYVHVKPANRTENNVGKFNAGVKLANNNFHCCICGHTVGGNIPMYFSRIEKEAMIFLLL